MSGPSSHLISQTSSPSRIASSTTKIPPSPTPPPSSTPTNQLHSPSGRRVKDLIKAFDHLANSSERSSQLKPARSIKHSASPSRRTKDRLFVKENPHPPIEFVDVNDERVVAKPDRHIRDFIRRRVIPGVTCLVALYFISPRLGAKLWFQVYRLILKKPLFFEQPRKTQPRHSRSFGIYTPDVGFIGSLLMPMIVMAVGSFMFSHKSVAERIRVRRKSFHVVDTDLNIKFRDPMLPVPAKSNRRLSCLPNQIIPNPTSKPASTHPPVQEVTKDDKDSRENLAPEEPTNATLENLNIPSVLSPRNLSKRLPTPPSQPNKFVDESIMLHDMKIGHGLGLDGQMAAILNIDPNTIPSDSPGTSPETTPKMKHAQYTFPYDSEADFIASVDEDTLNSILYSTPAYNADSVTPLISDQELAKLFPLPSQSPSPRLQLSPAWSPSRMPVSKGTTSSQGLLFSTPKAHSLDYMGLNLTFLPTKFPVHANLTRLHLTRNSLTDLPDDTLALLPSLKFLDISDNKINCLRKGVAVGCKGLRELYARNCGLSLIEEGVLEGLSNLEVLDLSTNNLSSFSNFAFAHNTSHLHTLILSDNKFKTLPPSLGLHRGRELVFLLLHGNKFEQSLKVFTDPIVSASQGVIARITKDIGSRLVVMRDSEFRDGTSLAVEKSDKGSLYDWDDDDLRSIHDAEFDAHLNGYQKPAEPSRIRRPSSLPDVFRLNSSSRRVTAVTRHPKEFGGHGGGKDQLEASSTTSYHASTNPSYVYIQRLLSHLRDVFDLSPQFHPYKRTPSPRTSRPSSKLDVREESFNSLVSPTDDDPEAPGLTEEQRERIRTRQSPTRRAHIVAEVLSTERTYVNELKTLVSLYADPLERGILSAADMTAMFSNLKSILNFHKSHMLPNLERAIQEPNQLVGSVFNEAAPFLKMYSTFFNNFDTANEMVVHLEQLAQSGTGQLQNPLKSTALLSTSLSPTASTQASRRTLAKKFKNLVKIAKSSPSHSQISLQSYFILPVQRLPRYKLLVDQLLESTPPNHPDRPNLQSAAEGIKICVAECNDKKREMEEYELGVKQMGRIRVNKSKSTGGGLHKFRTSQRNMRRQFVRDGSLRVVKYVERQHNDSAEAKSADLQFAMISSRDRYFKNVVGAVMEVRFSMGTGVVVANVPPPIVVLGQPPLGAGLDAMSVYGVQRTGGGEFRFLLFTDMLCWCKPIPGTNSSPLAGGVSSTMEAEFDLIRVLDIGSNTSLEIMCVLGHEPEIGRGRPFANRSNSSSTDHLKAYAASQSSVGNQWSLTGNSNLTLTNSRGSAASSPPTTRESESVLRIADNDSVLYLRGAQTELESWIEALKGLGCVGDD